MDIMVSPVDYKIAYQMVKETNCSACKEPFHSNEIQFDVTNNQQSRFECEYQCPECDTLYDITVFEETEDTITLHKDRQDIKTAPNRPATGVSKTCRSSLYKETLSVREIVEALDELCAALRILTTNKKRLTEIFDRIDQKNVFNQLSEFFDRIDADIHNYIAASYTFDERLETLESVLSTDNHIEAERVQFKAERAVIRGLRIFVQHNSSISSYLHAAPVQETAEYKTTIAIDLERVRDMEYDHDEGADHYYSDVDGEQIDLKQEVEHHFQAVNNVFTAIWDHTIDQHKDAIEEYDRLSAM